MAETKAPVRLSKAARELNVGISTIVDFLGSKGHDIDAKPNNKLEPALYDLVLAEFMDEKVEKQKAAEATSPREERETISISNTDRPASTRKPEEEIMIKNVHAPQREVIKPEVEDKPKVSVVGKIDLEKKPAAKEEKPAPKKEAPAAKAEEKPVEKAPAAKAKAEPKADVPAEAAAKEDSPKADVTAESKAEAPKEEAPKADVSAEAVAKEEAPKEETPAKKEDEVIKAKSEKLAGPTVVGKIVLPEKPKPVASSSDADGLARRKRKRKRIGTEPPSRPGGPGNRGGQRGGPGQRGGQRGGPGQRGGRGAKPELDAKEIQKEIKETLARLSGGGKSKSAKLRRAKRDAVGQKRDEEMARAEEQSTVLMLTEFVTVADLAIMMNVPATDVISACMTLGIFAAINQRLDAETLTIIAEEFGYTIDFVSADVQDQIVIEEDKPEDLESRSPIVTVMGHVDHGKTSLLDHIRKANVIAGEAGGITQHIGAYSVEVSEGKKITFLDTPGHEAFTAMRARGAQVTDLVIIVIAADDNVMPQTKEAINHAQAAGVPMVFAINKVDKPGANPEKIKEELSAMNILVESWGGKFQDQEISAKKGTGIDELLEKVLLESELLDLKANPKKNATGVVIESSLDKGRGFVTTLLVESGTLNVGDVILAGCHSGRVKAMHNERGADIESVGPAGPVSLLGLNGAPNAGDKFNVMDDDREARQIATKRLQLQREQGVRTQKHITLDEIGRRLAIGDFQELNIIVKGDVDGSIEALTDSLMKLSTEQVQVNVIHKAVGQISESDVLLASASDAIIIGFQVRPSASARRLAEKEQIDIRLYSIIYNAIEEVKDAMEGLLSPDVQEKVVGTAEIREVYKITKVGSVAGCYVLDGKIGRNNDVRIIRDGIVVYTGELGSLKRFKDDVKEVQHGYECGLNIEKFNDIKVGDNIEAYEQVEVKKKL